MNKVTRFLWWCAGARIDILEMEDCKSDHAKFFGIGGTIVFTALMASFAGGYAFYTAFKNPVSSVFFGAFWGLLIFNLDRYIVSTIKDDGKASISRGEIINATPRLIMAVLLGFVISTPLELKIFETEIKTVVDRLKIEKAEELKNRDISFNNEFDETSKDLTKVQSDLTELTKNKKQLSQDAGAFFDQKKKDLQKDLDDKRSEQRVAENKVAKLNGLYLQAIRDSLSNNTIASRRRSRDNAAVERNNLRSERVSIEKDIEDLNKNKGQAIADEQKRIDKQINLLLNEKTSLVDKVNQLRNTRTKKRENYESKTENYDGFAAHLEAMSVLTSEKSSIFWAKWLITFLFIFIEVAPVLFKLMVEAGPYDEILHRQKYEAMIKQKLAISAINDEINSNLKISSEKEKLRLEAELKGNQELLQAIALAQADIGKKAVAEWKKKELKKIDQSIDHLINSENDEPNTENLNSDTTE